MPAIERRPARGLDRGPDGGCRRYAERQGWQLVRIYEDRALSGASAARPGYQALLADAERGLFDVVVVEALDRIGRRLADVAGLHDRLEFRRIALHAVNMGAVATMHVGLLGTMAQLYLSDLKDKTRRGQLGRGAAGQGGGWRAYGYRAVEGETGSRRIDEGEAGRCAPHLQALRRWREPTRHRPKLNAEKRAGSGRAAVAGHDHPRPGRARHRHPEQRALQRPAGLEPVLYIKDPRTGRRLSRPNPPELWERSRVAELRIVDDALWEAVKHRQQVRAFTVARDEGGQALNRAHRRRFLLSGLLAAAAVRRRLHDHGQGPLWLCRAPQQGHLRQRPDDRPAGDQGRVLDGLKHRLLAPDLFEEFARSYEEECNRLARDAVAGRAALEGRLAQVERKIASIIRAVEDGLYQPSMKDRLEALEAEKARLVAERAAKADTPPVALHPNLPALYRKKVEELEAVLADAELGAEAMEAIRAMITRIVLRPGEAGGMKAVLEGDLAQILTICAGAERKNARLGGGRSGAVPVSQVSVAVVVSGGFCKSQCRLGVMACW